MSTADITEIDYGPLQQLIGTWKGDKGLDIAPESDGTEKNPYYETIVFEEGGDVTNAESQVLAIVPYHQVVRRKSNDRVFHDERGYWLWDAANQTIMHSFTIPRAVCVIAGGQFDMTEYDPKKTTFEVSATLGDPNWGIIQSPFMRDNATTNSFTQCITVGPDKLLYMETTILEIYGNTFEHTDENELVRV